MSDAAKTYMALEGLLTAREELLLLMSMLEPGTAGQARSILGRVEHAIELLRALQ